MWNWKILARWQYFIPYVDRYHLFAMPILGYLPFGLQVIALSAVGLLPGDMLEDNLYPITRS